MSLDADLRASNRATLTMAEAASLLGVDARTVSGAVRAGDIPAVRVGRRVLLPRARFFEWLDGGPTEPAEPAAIDPAPTSDPAAELRAQLLRVILGDTTTDGQGKR